MDAASVPRAPEPDRSAKASCPCAPSDLTEGPPGKSSLSFQLASSLPVGLVPNPWGKTPCPPFLHHL